MLAGLRQSLRTVARAPLTAATAILCLGAGMAATITVFTLLRSTATGAIPGITDRQTLSRLDIEANIGGRAWVWMANTSLRTFEGLQAHGPAVRAVGAESLQFFAIRTAGDAVSVKGAFVSGNYFTTLGTTPQLGRLLEPSDDRPDADVAVIGGALWRIHLGGKSDVLGQSLTIAGRRLRVVGVAPDRFTGLQLEDLDRSGFSYQQVWLPLSLAKGWPGIDAAKFEVDVAVRHAPGVAREQAQRALNELVGTLEAPTFQGQPQPFRVALRHHGYSPRTWTAEAMLTSLLAMFPPLVVLAIACANVANLRLAHATTRVHEFAVRISLGATRGQIIRILALESAIVTAASALVASLLTRLVLTELARVTPMAPTADLMVVAFVFAVVIGVILVSGVAPAWRATARVQAFGLRQNAQSGGHAHSRLRNTLIGVQVALSIGLLAVTAMSVRTLTLAIDRTSVITDGLLEAIINLEQVEYKGPEATRFVDALVERLRADPRVQRAAVSNASVFGENEEFYARPGDEGSTRRVAAVTHATPDWFDILRLRTLTGRVYSDADRGAPVAVVNEALARVLDSSGGSVVGTPLRIRGFQPGSPPPQIVTVIGVVTNAVRAPDRLGSRPAVYLQIPPSAGSSLLPILAIRTDDPAALVPDVKRLIAELEPKRPIVYTETGAEALARQTQTIRAFAWIMGSLGLLALVLATAGLYAVTLYVTSLRTREIGIRVAIGAQQGDVIRLILRQALTVVGIGCVVGLILVVPIAFTMRSLFVGVSPADPLSLGPTLALLLTAGLAAAILPALRASRIDPVRALKHE